MTETEFIDCFMYIYMSENRKDWESSWYEKTNDVSGVKSTYSFMLEDKTPFYLSVLTYDKRMYPRVCKDKINFNYVDMVLRK